MQAHRSLPLAVGIALVLAISGCASDGSTNVPDAQNPETDIAQDVTQEQSADSEPSAPDSDITIPAGAYAASDEFPFPVPEGWVVLDEFTEGTLGKDITMDGSVEYPGDAKTAAATYLTVLTDAGFNAYTYGPGELTNEASLAAEGSINGVLYTVILNFDVHADGYQRVSITAAVQD